MPRRIPATMATQHPDNAFQPYWHRKAFVSTAHEVEECYRSYADLGCQEYMWDWEGKFVDEAVVDRLYQRYFDYFKKEPLGVKRFLTFRIPNIRKEGLARLSRAFTGILSAAYSARELGIKHPPLFEVIHPMTTHVDQLKTLQRKFHQTARFHRKILGTQTLKPEYLELIPLIEGTGTLLKSRQILERYAKFHETFTGKPIKVIRPFIARSDPALDGGFVAAVLSAKAALSEYFLFQKKTKIRIMPIIGAGSLHFRGGLSPDTVNEFLKTYPGIATVTLQSSFRYDHPPDKVKAAIAKLNRMLPAQQPTIFTPRDMALIHQLEAPLVRHYRHTIENLGGFINELARYIPARRERMQHTGHFGYSRQVGKKGLNLPRAIAFTAVFYSLGIPPELIGLGRGLKELHEKKILNELLRIYPELFQAVRSVGRFFNRENLEILSRRHPPWKFVRTGVQYIEEFLGESLGPKSPDDLLHRNYTSNVVQNWVQKKPLDEHILKAAQVRRSLG
jgi:phosphoenolpyruvate carboxylase